jgi:LSD1 subclass zinc finger protein
MNTDSPQPHCPYCANNMQFARTPEYAAPSALRMFECRGCRVVLTVPPGAEAFRMSAAAGNG